jgi:hypothetical protein
MKTMFKKTKPIMILGSKKTDICQIENIETQTTTTKKTITRLTVTIQNQGTPLVITTRRTDAKTRNIE